MMRALLVLALSLLVAACAVFESMNQRSADRSSAQSRYFLSLTPKSLGRNLSLSQLVTGEFKGRTYRARYEVEIIGDTLTIVGVSPLGITLFALTQKGDTVTLDSRVKELSGFDPRYTLFDIYLSYWPAQVLERALRQNGLTLNVNAEKSSRTVRDTEGRTVATVTYPRDANPGGTSTITRSNPEYRLGVSPLKVPGQP